jgi:hypothetical protein
MAVDMIVEAYPEAPPCWNCGGGPIVIVETPLSLGFIKCVQCEELQPDPDGDDERCPSRYAE